MMTNEPVPTPAPTRAKRGSVTVADVPHMAARYDPANTLPPSKVAAKSEKLCRWVCAAGPDHRYEAKPINVHTSARGACPFCIGRRASVTNRLDVLYPHVAVEWDPEANDRPATAVVATTEHRAWWRCSTCGHRWAARTHSRTVGGTGCPQCAKAAIAAALSTPAPGRSLPEVAPEVAAQWHPERNGALGPGQVAAFSHKPRWWRCAHHHEWEASPAGRVARGGTGCPVCSGRYATPETSLAALRPELAAQWHPTRNGALTPDTVTPQTPKVVWWRCPAGHDYQSPIAHRARRGRGCPYCAGRKLGYGNDLATQAPQVAAQWHPTKNGAATPATVPAAARATAWWRCAAGHEWKATVASRTGAGTGAGTGCPRCANAEAAQAARAGAETGGSRPRPTVPGTPPPPKPGRSLAQMSPVVAAEWHPTKNGELTAWEVANARNAPAWWLCSWCGAEWEALISTRVRYPELAGCRSCASKLAGAHQARPKPGASLADKHPGTAAQWHPILNGDLYPQDLKPGSARSVWWLCPAGHQWQAAVHRRTLGGRGCPRCAPLRRATTRRRHSPDRVAGPVPPGTQGLS